MIIVGKDFGAWPAYYFALKHPERALGVVTLGVPFMPPGSVRSTQSHIPEGVYTLRWRVPIHMLYHLHYTLALSKQNSSPIDFVVLILDRDLYLDS